MSDSLADLILALTPEDGASIGNGAMLALLREQMPDLAEGNYTAARDVLVDEGRLAKGKGRGGSIYRADVADLELASQEVEEAESTDKKKARTKSRKRSAKKQTQPTQVLSYRHNETRVNNPEVGMVHAGTDPDGDKTTWAYDPHLDPILNFDHARADIETLIDDALASDEPERMRRALTELKRLQQPYLEWTGKAEKTSFEVDTVSLHVHERADPATILANAEKHQKGKPSTFDSGQSDFFHAPFENLPLRQALEFYRHEKGWSNRLVTGDSLLVMNSLLTRESMGGKMQMIYIDPPYGIKYGSNFQPFTNKRDVKDRNDQDLTQEPEMVKAFRDTWELGIHSYLTYLRDRLLLARELLTESGSIFVQISDENLHHILELMDEIFGARNMAGLISFRKTSGLTSERLAQNADYIIWYSYDIKKVKFNQVFLEKGVDSNLSFYSYVELENGFRMRPKKNTKYDGSIRPYSVGDLTSSHEYSLGKNEFEYLGISFKPGSRFWSTSPTGMKRLALANRIHQSSNSIRFVRFIDDFPVQPVTATWTDTITGQYSEPRQYVVQTATSAIERCLLMTTDPGDLVLDPTCGSGTTAFAAEKWGRRWITCDTSRVAITLAKQRLMTASFDYYSLRYPQEGLKGGFDYETVPHITLKSIANNPDIDTIYNKEHPKIEAALAELNAALAAEPPNSLTPTQGVRKGKAVNFAKGDTLHEWEVPFDWPDEDDEQWPEAARKPFDAFHAARQAMQQRMDESIAAHADQETLYDKPHIDKNRLRITGPFSVEAVPAPTVLSLDDNAPLVEADASVARSGETSRQAMWRDELLKTGVRGKGGAMLQFAEFETLPGLKYIHASGSLSETGERVVVSFGPEHAALEQRQVELALTEAESLRPAPAYVLFCAFTFDPEASKDIDEVNWPGVTLLKAQMNTDLLTADLKKSRASNQSFWLMGQPEVELRRNDDGTWVVEVHGFDYFNPKTGEVDSGGKSQIAMWSLDADYDERSLMPHQVFFPMADGRGGWNRLRRTVRAELDEELMEQFHGTVSLPFEAGENKRIAVKIVDDRGIESLKIMNLED